MEILAGKEGNGAILVYNNYILFLHDSGVFMKLALSLNRKSIKPEGTQGAAISVTPIIHK